jgi:F-type H+-transporting ATPase subunit delta
VERLSRPVLTRRAERLLQDAARAGALDQVASELATFARLTASYPRLRTPLVDPGLPVEARGSLVSDLGRGQPQSATVELVSSIADLQRIPPRLLPDLLAELSAQATLAAADADGELREVEDDMFRFGETVERSHELFAAFEDPVIPVERKRALVDDLLRGRANRRTVELVELLIDLDEGHDLGQSSAKLSDWAAERRNRVVADVRTAVPMDDQRQARLAEALSRAVGRPVELRCTVDTSIMGSVVARVGDEVFDGSVRSRIQQARERLGVA